MDDKEIMNEAFKEAQKAYERGEAPVGALIYGHDEYYMPVYGLGFTV